MKIRRLVTLGSMLLCVAMLQAKTLLYPDSETAQSEVELGVEGIQRICPTGMWNHWSFRDILYDRDSNTVLMIVQLKSWRARNEDKVQGVTEAEAQKETERIISNIKKGYEDLIKNPSVRCDGDFMLYLSLGTLFHQMVKDGSKLRIMLLKPDYCNQVFGDIPMEYSPEQIKQIRVE